ncbi:DUF6435 family protein [Marinomonas sp. 15G1-11]|uniref:DUF6435 family protein n=1 Tax=Marinomonas phaeophyticola TaxID=3004091 RepID=A0ABT4JQ96_9GAMM|nr:DUF6435 family protein [Marinomonas sp. 15G1-11]MCZ2720326.1 DUF6435 family protein [Marinomonas sp. 15G1-11]
MFSIFKTDPIKKLNKMRDIKLEQGMQAQRNGDIRKYSQLTFEAEELYEEILLLEEKKSTISF